MRSRGAHVGELLRRVRRFCQATGAFLAGRFGRGTLCGVRRIRDAVFDGGRRRFDDRDALERRRQCGCRVAGSDLVAVVGVAASPSPGSTAIAL